MSNNSQLEKEFVPYEESLALKELGFDEPCFGYYIELVKPIEGILTIEQCDKNVDGCCIAPTFSQAFRWFREKHNLIGGIEYIGGAKPETTWWDVYVIGHFNTNTSKMTMKYQPYEQAELECLRKLIEIVKETHK